MGFVFREGYLKQRTAEYLARFALLAVGKSTIGEAFEMLNCGVLPEAGRIVDVHYERNE